jgi:hypothetical protein
MAWQWGNGAKAAKPRSTGRDSKVGLRFLPCLTKSRQPATLAKLGTPGWNEAFPESVSYCASATAAVMEVF